MVLNKFANKSFFTRTISGIVLVALMLATIIPGGNILFVANLIISLVGLYELYKVLGIEERITGFTGYLAVIGYYFVILFNRKDFVVLILVAFLMILLAEYVLLFPKIRTEEVSNAVMCVIYAGIMLSYLYNVRTMKDGVFTVWLIFLCSWGSDTCAYLAGVAFGKHKMAPVLSPKKTIEGAVGGIVGAAILGGIYAAIFASKINMNNPILVFPIVCAIGAIISMIGDLAASAIKRNHDIKDYGKIIPGHGGIMDRFDSVIFVAPVVWVLLKIF